MNTLESGPLQKRRPEKTKVINKEIVYPTVCKEKAIIFPGLQISSRMDRIIFLKLFLMWKMAEFLSYGYEL